jgi:hypothetical protein
MDVWVDTRYCQSCHKLFVVECDCPPVSSRRCSMCRKLLFYHPRTNSLRCHGGCDG